MSIFLGILIVLLVLLSGFLGLIVLLQRPRADSGMGAALGGGGVIEGAFGGDTSNVLTRITSWCLVFFFVGAFVAYLGYIHVHRSAEAAGALPDIEVPAATEVPPPATGSLSAPDIAVEPANAAAAETVTPAEPPPAAPETSSEAAAPAAP